MNFKMLIGLIAASTLLVGGCTTQTNKPPAGAGHTGPVSDGALANGNPSGSSNGAGRAGQGGTGSNNAGGRNQNGAGTGSHANGRGQGGSNGLGNNNGLNNGGRNQGGSGANNGNYGRGSNGGRNQSGFGSGSAYAGNTKDTYSPADLRDPRSILAQRIIYFDYDQSSIRPEYRRILDAHGSLLSDFPELNVRLEGHADERGSREYNVALSERRAFSVLDYLKIKGVTAGQADVVGYGEEVPATFGHGEDSWGKNRRVELIYAGE